MWQNGIGHAAVGGGTDAGTTAGKQGKETFPWGFIQFFTLFNRIACFWECLFLGSYPQKYTLTT